MVHELREPLVDVFEEENHVLIVAEMPGIEAEDVEVEIQDDILTLSAKRGTRNIARRSFSRELPEGQSRGLLQARNCGNQVHET